MPRCAVERTFSQRLHIPAANDGAELCRAAVEWSERGVTRVSSFVSADIDAHSGRRLPKAEETE